MPGGATSAWSRVHDVVTSLEGMVSDRSRGFVHFASRRSLPIKPAAYATPSPISGSAHRPSPDLFALQRYAFHRGSKSAHRLRVRRELRSDAANLHGAGAVPRRLRSGRPSGHASRTEDLRCVWTRDSAPRRPIVVRFSRDEQLDWLLSQADHPTGRSDTLPDEPSPILLFSPFA